MVPHREVIEVRPAKKVHEQTSVYARLCACTYGDVRPRLIKLDQNLDQPRPQVFGAAGPSKCRMRDAEVTAISAVSKRAKKHHARLIHFEVGER